MPLSPSQDPWMFFFVLTQHPYKSPLTSCVAFKTSVILWGHRQVCRHRCRGPRTPSKTIDANLDFSFAKKPTFSHWSLIDKSQQNRIELVTRPVSWSPPRWAPGRGGRRPGPCARRRTGRISWRPGTGLLRAWSPPTPQARLPAAWRWSWWSPPWSRPEMSARQGPRPRLAVKQQISRLTFKIVSE